MKDVKISDLKDLNKVLKWIKRVPSTIHFSRPSSPLCMTIIADSAYRADDVDCLALRAAIIGLCEVRGSTPSGCFHVWEYFSRKQAKVNRGTFSAELNNAIEATEYGMLLNGFMMEWLRGAQSAVPLHAAVDGPCGLDLHLVLDAHSVFAAVTAQEISTPTERQLLYGVRALREHLEGRRLSTIHRVDTRDMLCDALTKGGVP
eukprot:9336511-Pyramimonas_sp.AAC.1